MEKKTALSEDRRRILEKIEEYERLGLFDKDVEDDPPTVPLTPDKIKYLDRSLAAEAKRFLAFGTARLYFKLELLKKNLIIDGIYGVENLTRVASGAVITCNHFNPYDSFVMQYVFDRAKRRGRMYRVIREGNYTSFPGFYGFLMRNCDTLPLSSVFSTMKLFVKAADKALNDGNCLLVYPEESMWWNYRKPKPLKEGAFELAERSGVPVVPCFITLRDDERLGYDGYPIQHYTVHVGEPVYPDLTVSRRDSREHMREATFAFMKDTYERIYGIPLEYPTKYQ